MRLKLLFRKKGKIGKDCARSSGILWNSVFPTNIYISSAFSWFGCIMFREDSIVARAKQILGLKDSEESKVRSSFFELINKYHPDRQGSTYIEQTKVLIEAYKVLSGRINPLDCKLLEDEGLVASLLPKGAKPAKLGIRYEDWIKDRFYDFVKPREETDGRNDRKERIRRGL